MLRALPCRCEGKVWGGAPSVRAAVIGGEWRRRNTRRVKLVARPGSMQASREPTEVQPWLRLADRKSPNARPAVALARERKLATRPLPPTASSLARARQSGKPRAEPALFLPRPRTTLRSPSSRGTIGLPPASDDGQFEL